MTRRGLAVIADQDGSTGIVCADMSAVPMD